MNHIFYEEEAKFAEAMAKDPVKVSTPWAVERAAEKLRNQGAAAQEIETMRADPLSHPEFIRQRDLMQQQYLGAGHRPVLLSDQDKKQFYGLTGKDQSGGYLDSGAMGAALNGLVMRYSKVKDGASRVLSELGIHRTLAPVILSANGGYDDLTASIISVDRRVSAGGLGDKVAGEQLAVIKGYATKEQGAEEYADVKKAIMGSGFFSAMFSGDNTPEGRRMQNSIIFGFAQLPESRRAEILSAIDKGTTLVDVDAEPAVKGRSMWLANALWGKSGTKVALLKSSPLKPDHVVQAHQDASVMRAVRDSAIEFSHDRDYFEDGVNRAAISQLGISVDDKKDGNYVVRVAGANDGQLAYSAPQVLTKDALRQLVDKTADDMFSVDKLRLRNDGEQIALIGKDGRAMKRFDQGELAGIISGQMDRNEKAKADTLLGALEKVTGRAVAGTARAALDSVTPSQRTIDKASSQWRDFNITFEQVSGITGLRNLWDIYSNTVNAGVDAVTDTVIHPLVREGRRVRDNIVRKAKEE